MDSPEIRNGETWVAEGLEIEVGERGTRVVSGPTGWHQEFGSPITLTAADQRKIALVIADVHGGCDVCATASLIDLHRAIPAVDWPTMMKELRQAFGADNTAARGMSLRELVSRDPLEGPIGDWIRTGKVP